MASAKVLTPNVLPQLLPELAGVPEEPLAGGLGIPRGKGLQGVLAGERREEAETGLVRSSFEVGRRRSRKPPP